MQKKYTDQLMEDIRHCTDIEKCVEKYVGSYMITTEDRIFCTEIILPDVILE